MKKSIALILGGFESSSQKTPEFLSFFRTFKSEFKKELQSIGATDIVFNRGHFNASGFFTIDSQPYYFSVPDVRDLGHTITNYPNSSMGQMLYRTAKHYKDFTGGSNRYVRFGVGMAKQMEIN